MSTKIQELEIELAQEKTRADTWENAFKYVLQISKRIKCFQCSQHYSEENTEKVSEKKSGAEEYQAGEEYAVKHILANVKDEEVSEVGVQNAWLATAAAWLREQVVKTIIGALVKVVKENAVKTADWLLSQTEDVILQGYNRLSNEDKALVKNDLKQYPRFSELLKKIEKSEQ